MFVAPSRDTFVVENGRVIPLEAPSCDPALINRPPVLSTYRGAAILSLCELKVRENLLLWLSRETGDVVEGRPRISMGELGGYPCRRSRCRRIKLYLDVLTIRDFGLCHCACKCLDPLARSIRRKADGQRQKDDGEENGEIIIAHCEW